MKRITIRKDEMYPYYYIDENPEEDEPTIELPNVIIEDYGKMLHQFRRVQLALCEFMSEQK